MERTPAAEQEPDNPPRRQAAQPEDGERSRVLDLLRQPEDERRGKPGQGPQA